MRILKDKSGLSYVLVCAIILIVSMMIFVCMQYSSVLIKIDSHKSETRLKLEACVMRSAIDNYDALKQGSVYYNYVDTDRLVEDAYSSLGFSWDTAYIEDSGCVMTRPDIVVTADGGYGLSVSYELTVPFELLDRTVTEITVPVYIVAEYKER